MDKHICRIILVAVICFSACMRADERDLQVDITNADERYLEDLATDVRIIPLRDRDSVNIIGDIYSLKSYGSKLFLYDDRARKIIYYEDGIYAGQIDKVGRGPEEYCDIGTFAYDAGHDYLGIFDRASKKIRFYDCSTSQMERDIQLDYYIGALEHISGDLFLAVRENSLRADDAAVIILDVGKETEVASLPITSVQGDLLYDIAITREEPGSVLITLPEYVNTVYRADTSGFSEVAGIFFGRHGADRKFWKGKRRDPFYIEKMLNGKPSSAIAPSYYTAGGEKEIFWYVSRYSYDVHSQPDMSLYIRNGGKGTAVSKLFIKGIDGGIQPLCAADGYYYTLVYPYQITGNNGEMSPVGAEISALADYENNNPSVVAFKF